MRVVTLTSFDKSWEQAVQWLRQQPDQQDLVTAGYYDDPLLSAATRYWQSDEWQETRRFLPPADCAKALDFGAGRGLASFALAMTGFDVTALEPDRSDLVGAGAIRLLTEQQGLRIRVCDEVTGRLPFSDSSFDVVFGRAVLHHVPDLTATCKELCRVLKRGGKFIAVREHVISRDSDLERFFEVHPLHRHYGGERAFRLEHYTNAIQGSGLQLERTLPPLRSAINLSPQTIKTLQEALARRVGLGLPVLTALLRRALQVGAVWSVLLPVLEMMDHRPGRLYSFIARKP